MKEKNNVVCNKMDGTGVYQTMWSQTEKDKYHMILLTCGIKKKMIQINLFTKHRLTDLKNGFMVAS